MILIYLINKFLVFCNAISIIIYGVNSNPFKTLSGIIKSFREKAFKAQRPGRGEFEIETRFDGEFPLANDNITIQAMNELWKSYYKCLEETAGYIGLHRSITPRAIAVFPGHSIKYVIYSVFCWAIECILFYTQYNVKASIVPMMLTQRVYRNLTENAITNLINEMKIKNENLEVSSVGLVCRRLIWTPKKRRKTTKRVLNKER